MKMVSVHSWLSLAVVLPLTSCDSQPKAIPVTPEDMAKRDPCSYTQDIPESSFVFVTIPRSGERMPKRFEVKGCSRTFESNVQWTLKARNGTVLASGHTSGGGVNGAKAFSFFVTYQIAEPQIGHLEVFEEDASGGEGFPPPLDIVPLVLAP